MSKPSDRVRTNSKPPLTMRSTRYYSAMVARFQHEYKLFLRHGQDSPHFPRIPYLEGPCMDPNGITWYPDGRNARGDSHPLLEITEILRNAAKPPSTKEPETKPMLVSESGSKLKPKLGSEKGKQMMGVFKANPAQMEAAEPELKFKQADSKQDTDQVGHNVISANGGFPDDPDRKIPPFKPSQTTFKKSTSVTLTSQKNKRLRESELVHDVKRLKSTHDSVKYSSSDDCGKPKVNVGEAYESKGKRVAHVKEVLQWGGNGRFLNPVPSDPRYEINPNFKRGPRQFYDPNIRYTDRDFEKDNKYVISRTSIYEYVRNKAKKGLEDLERMKPGIIRFPSEKAIDFVHEVADEIHNYPYQEDRVQALVEFKRQFDALVKSKFPKIEDRLLRIAMVDIPPASLIAWKSSRIDDWVPPNLRVTQEEERAFIKKSKVEAQAEIKKGTPAGLGKRTETKKRATRVVGGCSIRGDTASLLQAPVNTVASAHARKPVNKFKASNSELSPVYSSYNRTPPAPQAFSLTTPATFTTPVGSHGSADVIHSKATSGTPLASRIDGPSEAVSGATASPPGSQSLLQPSHSCFPDAGHPFIPSGSDTNGSISALVNLEPQRSKMESHLSLTAKQRPLSANQTTVEERLDNLENWRSKQLEIQHSKLQEINAEANWLRQTNDKLGANQLFLVTKMLVLQNNARTYQDHIARLSEKLDEHGIIRPRMEELDQVLDISGLENYIPVVGSAGMAESPRRDSQQSG